MSAHSEQVREQLKNAFSHYKFKDERCGMCCSDSDGNQLVKRLSKKPLREFTVEDVLAFGRLLQCQPDTGAKFILPRLLDLNTTESEQVIREKYKQLRLHFTAQEQLAVDAYLEEEWRAALGTRNLPTILNRLSFIKILSGRVEPFLAEWLGSGVSIHTSIVELALSIWRSGVPDPLDKNEIQDWLLTDVARCLQRASDQGAHEDERTQQAVGLLRSYAGS